MSLVRNRLACRISRIVIGDIATHITFASYKNPPVKRISIGYRIFGNINKTTGEI